MIFRAILLELTGGTEELHLEARALHAGGRRGTELTWERLELGGLRLEDDGWHLVGTGGELGPTAYQSPLLALRAKLEGGSYQLAKRLSP